jgi:hypothetical protein
MQMKQLQQQKSNNDIERYNTMKTDAFGLDDWGNHNARKNSRSATAATTNHITKPIVLDIKPCGYLLEYHSTRLLWYPSANIDATLALTVM